MAKTNIVHKPLSNNEYDLLIGENPLTDLILQTGARIQEIWRLINEWNGNSDYIDIHTKMSGNKTNRIYLTKKATTSLEKCICRYKGLSVRTLSSKVKGVSDKFTFRFTAHNLRTTFATRLFERKVDIVSVSTLMNHSDISITAKYIQFNEKTLRRGLNSLDDEQTYEGYTVEEMIEALHQKSRIIRELEGKLYER